VYDGQIAEMAPATQLGAATPLPFPKICEQPAIAEKSPAQAASAENGNTESHKVLNDSIAYLRSLAQLPERNVEWAEPTVRRAAGHRHESRPKRSRGNS
jgi:membrane-bound serine protease (ClpP class)